MNEDIRYEKEKDKKIPCIICEKKKIAKKALANIHYMAIICDECRTSLQKLIKP